MRHYHLMVLSLLGGILLCVLWSSSCQAQSFDQTKLRPFVDGHNTPARNRIDQAIASLRKEWAHPSRPAWGVGGGPIDTGYIQASILYAMAFPAAEDRDYLRQVREKADPRLKVILAVPAGLSGAQDGVADLVSLVRKSPEGSIRQVALRTLREMLQPARSTDVPPRLRPGEVWKPLDDKTQQAIQQVQIEALNDPYKRYRGAAKDEKAAYYPGQDEAALGLRKQGMVVQPTPTGWKLSDRQGNLIRIIPRKPSPNAPPK